MPHPRSRCSNRTTPTPRDGWTDAERALIDQTPKRLHHRRKLTDDQIIELRRRVDSLTVPWTIDDLVRDFGISREQARRVARRESWPDRKWEPEGVWWREKEIEEMLDAD